MGSDTEIISIVDRDNVVVGAATRAEMRARNLPHRATYILVFNSRGELFVHQRAASKDVYPAHFDVVAGGIVLQGESYLEGAERELAEELGIRDVPLEELFDFWHEDGGNRVWGRVFVVTYDGELRLQEEEIDSGEFLPLGEVWSLAELQPFTPDGLIVLRRYLERDRE